MYEQFNPYRIACDLWGLHRRLRRVERNMATQGDLDRLVARLGTALDAIRTEISAVQTKNPDLDLTGLEQAVSSAESEAQSAGTLPASDAASTPQNDAQGQGGDSSGGQHEAQEDKGAQNDSGRPLTAGTDWS